MTVKELRELLRDVPNDFVLYVDDCTTITAVHMAQVQEDSAMDPTNAVVFYFGAEAEACDVRS